MVDKLDNLDNLITKLNNILSKDKRFENEINHDYYLKKLSKKTDSRNVEMSMPIMPIMPINDYSVNLTVKKEPKEKCSYEDDLGKLEKDLEDLIRKLSSTTSLDLSLLLSELQKLKNKSRENLKDIKNL
jgi:hypothetical protein